MSNKIDLEQSRDYWRTWARLLLEENGIRPPMNDWHLVGDVAFMNEIERLVKKPKERK